MSAPWESRTVAELCSRVTSGGTPSRARPDYYGGHIPWVKTGELLDREILDSEEHLTEAGLQSSSAKLLPAGTVLMAMYGATVGALGRLGREATCNQASCAMVADSRTTDARWLYYALLNDRPRIVSRATGAAQQNLSAATIKQFAYPAPPLPEQQAIAEVLGALDDKVAANTALAATAWAFMETEFRAVRADPECTRTRLGAIASLEYGKALPASVRESGEVSVVGSGGVSGVHSKALIDRSGVVVGRKGSAGAVHWVSGPHFPIDTTFYVRGTDDAVSQPFLYFLLRTLRLDEMNNDSAVPGLNRSEALALPIWRPTPARLASFTAQAEGQIALVEGIDRENRTLAATRDALLPQLMSGKLRVRDAEAVASEAGA